MNVGATILPLSLLEDGAVAAAAAAAVAAAAAAAAAGAAAVAELIMGAEMDHQGLTIVRNGDIPEKTLEEARRGSLAWTLVL